MNKFQLFLAAVAVSAGANSLAQDSSALLLSGSDRGTDIELYAAEAVSAFDVSVPVRNPSAVVIDGCVSGLPNTHVGNCAINDEGVLKLIVFSPSNATLQSGFIGSLQLDGALFGEAVVNAFAPDGAAADIEFLAQDIGVNGGQGKLEAPRLPKRSIKRGVRR